MKVRIDSTGRDEDGKTFTSALENQCATLGVSLDVETAAPLDRPDSKSLLVLFLDPASPLRARDQDLKAFVDAGGTIIPVARTAAEAGQVLGASSIGHLNALRQDQYGKGNEWVAALVDEVLAHLWVRRMRKRLFISYKRKDSAGVARQLFDRISRLGFEVFLDESTIGPADDFQARLKWWLNDADLLVLLASPNLESSRWVLEEIAFAQNHGIGVLALEWPKEVYEGTIEFDSEAKVRSPPKILDALMADQRMTLERAWFTEASGSSPPDFIAGEKSELHGDRLNEVVAECFRRRTIGLRDRLVDVLTVAKEHLAAKGQVASQDEVGDLLFDQNNERHLVRILPFRPDTTVFYNLGEAAELAKARVAGCLYTEPSPAHAEVVALHWCLEVSRKSPSATASEKAVEFKVWTHPGGSLP
jgi:hypothetical protein